MDSFLRDLGHAVEDTLTSRPFLTALGIRLLDFAIRLGRDWRNRGGGHGDRDGRGGGGASGQPPQRGTRKRRSRRGRKR